MVASINQRVPVALGSGGATPIGFERLVPAQFLDWLRFGHLIAEEVELVGSRQHGEASNRFKQASTTMAQAMEPKPADSETALARARLAGRLLGPECDWQFGIKQQAIGRKGNSLVASAMRRRSPHLDPKRR